jgi:hypothetical protein
MKKRIFVVILALVLVVALAACNSGGPNDGDNQDEENKIFKYFEELNETITDCSAHYQEVAQEKGMPEEDRQLAGAYFNFSLDVALPRVNGNSAAQLICEIVERLNAGTLNLEEYEEFGITEIEKDGENYVFVREYIKDGETVNESGVIKTNPEGFCLITDDAEGNFKSRSEFIRIAEGKYAFRNVVKQGNSFTVFSLYLESAAGRLSYDENVTADPGSIYDNPSLVNNNFGKTGANTFLLTADDFTYNWESEEE